MRIGDALLSEVWHDRAKIVAPHSHELDYFSILLAGSYCEWAHDFMIAYQPYTLVFHSANREHQDEITQAGTQIFFIELYPPWGDVLRSLGTPRAHFFELHGGEPTWLALRVFREFSLREVDAQNALDALLFELCSFAVDDRLPDDEPSWVGHIDRELRSNFAGAPSIGELAESVGINAAHLCRTFRRFRRRPIGDHIRGLRVQFACRRLTESDDSLSAIAATAGFVDQSHMTKSFKRLTGYAPGMYRDLVRKGLRPREP